MSYFRNSNYNYNSNKGSNSRKNKGWGSDYDDYYETYYGGGSYSYKGNYWNSFSWSLKEEDEDNETDLHIKASEGYLTPTNKEISRRLSYTHDNRDNKILVKNLSRFFYLRMIDDDAYFSDKFDESNIPNLSSELQEKYEQYKTFYKELWEKEVPGVSPMDKAINLLEELSRKNKGEVNQNNLMDDLMEKHQTIKMDEDIYSDPIFNELMDINEFTKNRKFEILDKLSLVKHFDSAFKVQKEVEERIVANSSIIVPKRMTDISQLPNVEIYQRLLPNFKYKLAVKDLGITVPVDRTEHKQKIIMLVDYSGSISWYYEY